MTVSAAVAFPDPPAPVQVRMKLKAPAVVGVCDAVPLLASEPLHAPLAVQAVALVADHVTVAL